MGVSTDGILCYGFSLGDEEGVPPEWLLKEDSEDDEEEMGFDDFLAKVYGIPHPGEWKEDEETKKKFSEYWEKQRKLEEEVGVKLVFHCSGEYTMYILAVKESVHTANRGDPIELGQSISVKPEWREKLKSFCEKAGIEFQEPQFILCSYWG